MKTYYKKTASPIGELYIVATDEFLVGLSTKKGWDDLQRIFELPEKKDNKILIDTQNQLDEYFKRERKIFDLPIKFIGTDFQRSVWKALLDIPYGETISYQQQAKNIGNPKALRAVGGANGKNPIGIIVPCHRVIGKSGKLTGYAGGLEIKKYLLDLENSQ